MIWCATRPLCALPAAACLASVAYGATDLKSAVLDVAATVELTTIVRERADQRAPELTAEHAAALAAWRERYGITPAFDGLVAQTLGPRTWAEVQATLRERVRARVDAMLPPRLQPGSLASVLGRPDFDLQRHSAANLAVVRRHLASAAANERATDTTAAPRAPLAKGAQVAVTPPAGDRGPLAAAVDARAAVSCDLDIGADRIEGLYSIDTTDDIYGPFGMQQNFGARNVLLFRDGTAYREPAVPPACLDRGAARRKEPDRWGRWVMRGDAVHITWERPQGEREEIVPVGARVEALPAGTPLAGTIRHSVGASNPAAGVGGLQTREITFFADRRFEDGSSTSMAAPDAAGFATDTRRGRYQVTPYGLHLRYDDGRRDDLLAFVYTRDRRTGRIQSLYLGGRLVDAGPRGLTPGR